MRLAAADTASSGYGKRRSKAVKRPIVGHTVHHTWCRLQWGLEGATDTPLRLAATDIASLGRREARQQYRYPTHSSISSTAISSTAIPYAGLGLGSGRQGNSIGISQQHHMACILQLPHALRQVGQHALQVGTVPNSPLG